MPYMHRYLILSNQDLDSICAISVVMMALNQRRFLDGHDYGIDVEISSNEYDQIFLLGLGAEEVSEVLQLCSGEFVWISNDVSSKLSI